MLIHIPALLTPADVASCRKVLDAAKWLDGRASAGATAMRVKHNTEADLTDPPVRQLSDFILRALAANQSFVATALPARYCPPSFNRYAMGQNYGTHNDGALFEFAGPSSSVWVRSDLAATLFLSPPEDYDGGELVIEDTFGPARVKLAAGDMVLYPSSSQHRVEPVTRGVRLASYFWVQSLVRDDSQRQLLRDLDGSIMQLSQACPATGRRCSCSASITICCACGRTPRADHRFMESAMRSRSLFGRNSGRKTVSHFSWNCSTSRCVAAGTLRERRTRPEWPPP